MSISTFRQKLQLQETELSQNEKAWFPKWLMAYCSFHKLEASADSIPISVELAIPFSQSLKATNTPAWQRLQAILALDCYQRLNGAAVADFFDMKHRLR